MTRPAFIFPALLFTIVAALVLYGFFYEQYAWIVIMFPLASGVALCGLCVNEMIAVFGGRTQTVPADPDDPEVPLSPISLGWMFALLPFLYVLGFVFGSAAYLLVCLRSNGFSWRLSLGVALVSIAATWGLFIHVLGILLPVQPLWME